METNKRWEEEFDEEFEKFYDLDDEKEHYNNLKSFISKVEKEAEERAYQRAVEEVENKYKPLLINEIENVDGKLNISVETPENAPCEGEILELYYSITKLQALKGEEITFFEQEKERWSEETKRRREDLD